MHEHKQSPDIAEQTDLVQSLKTEPIVDRESGIQLVPFDGSHVEVEMYEKWFNDPEVCRYLHPNTPYTDNSEQRGTVKEFIRYMTTHPAFAYYRIIHPLYGFIGHQSAAVINIEERSCYIGYVIGEKQCWGKGIGSVVTRMLLDRLKEVGMRKVKANAHIENVASIKILTKYFGEGKVDGESIEFQLDL